MLKVGFVNSYQSIKSKFKQLIDQQAEGISD